jgi:hypothetical protein
MAGAEMTRADRDRQTTHAVGLALTSLQLQDFDCGTSQRERDHFEGTLIDALRIAARLILAMQLVVARKQTGGKSELDRKMVMSNHEPSRVLDATLFKSDLVAMVHSDLITHL